MMWWESQVVQVWWSAMGCQCLDMGVVGLVLCSALPRQEHMQAELELLHVWGSEFARVLINS